MWVYMYVCTLHDGKIRMHAYVTLQMYVHTYVCVCKYISGHIHVRRQASMYVCTDECIQGCMDPVCFMHHIRSCTPDPPVGCSSRPNRGTGPE